MWSMLVELQCLYSEKLTHDYVGGAEALSGGLHEDSIRVMTQSFPSCDRVYPLCCPQPGDPISGPCMYEGKTRMPGGQRVPWSSFLGQ